MTGIADRPARMGWGRPLRLGVVSGDGLPVSGLLTETRNVVDLALRIGEVALPIPADLGYSWRPDKGDFFPDGAAAASGDTLFEVAGTTVTRTILPSELARRLDAVRRGVAAHDELDDDARTRLRAEVERLAVPYQRDLSCWLSAHDLDWVLAVNMTLSDSVPATLALHRAAERHFAARPGGVVFWDHDLFGSCAIHDHNDGRRLYPPRPNSLTPLPGSDPHTRWFVVSEALAREARRYPTDADPIVVPNLLPRVLPGIDERHRAFAAERRIDPRRPLLLNPVRVFRIKGVEHAVDLLSAMRREAPADHEVPYLLVFGSLAEEPDYAAEIVDRADRLGVRDDVRFLDGVPLRSGRDGRGRWQLDEVDLLRLAAHQGGAVVFTPAPTDVETVGLAPGLAAVAGLPCAITPYDAFTPCYGPELACTILDRSSAGIETAARRLLDQMTGVRHSAPAVIKMLERNERIARERFPEAPWAAQLEGLFTANQTGVERRPG